MNSDGNVSFVRRAAQITSVGDEQEAFYLRVYGVGQYRYYGADLGILVAHGRMQTDDRKLIDRAKLWNAGIKAQFQGVAPDTRRAAGAAAGLVGEDVLGCKFLANVEMTSPPIIDKLPKMRVSDVVSLWRNAATMLGEPKRRNMHSQARAALSAINAEWLRRRRQPLNGTGYFAWPSAEASGGDGSLSADGWLKEGILHHMGYAVGATDGKTAPVREAILEGIFAAVQPPLIPVDALEEWGVPEAPKRLQKWRKRLHPEPQREATTRSRMDVAIKSWDQDLEHLYWTFYVDKFHFARPSSQI